VVEELVFLMLLAFMAFMAFTPTIQCPVSAVEAPVR
jgi:hypothetical protein